LPFDKFLFLEIAMNLEVVFEILYYNLYSFKLSGAEELLVDF
jgi:hypothetical protein